MWDKLKTLYPILLLTAGHGAVDSYLGLLPVLAPGLSEFLGIPLGDIIMLIGISALLNNLLQPVVGWLMGRYNLAWTLWFAVILSSLPVFMGYVTGMPALAFIIILGALGTGLYHPEAALSAHDVTGDKAYLGIPLFMAGGAAIYAIITPLSIKITETYGFPALVWLLIPGVVVFLLLLLSYRERKRKHPSIVLRPRSKRMTKVHAGNVSFWPLLVAGAFFNIGSGLFLSVFSSHFELQFGATARHWSGWGLMIMGVGGSLSAFGWSALSRRKGFYRIALCTQVLAVPLFLAMAYVGSPELGVWLTVPLSVVTPAAIHPVAVTLARNAAGSTQAMRTSLMIGGTYGLAALGVMAAGVLLRRGMDSSWIIVFVACCSFAAAIVALSQLIANRSRPVLVEE